jgi:pimeloyl-ACP methyl ester carboxylesterase
MVTLDDPAVSTFVFHPRAEAGSRTEGALATETLSKDAVICGYLHPNENSDTLMLFFHGNGEIAADYDALGHLYVECGASFWVVDYRGYGRSTGTPSFSRMLTDAEAVFNDVPALEAAADACFSRIAVMGRSLGSASAIRLAAAHPDRVSGLLLDSPFADGPALIRRLGGPDVEPLARSAAKDNIDRIRDCRMPTLIIHGTEDWIIPVVEAEALHEACPGPQKRLVKIRGAGHNDLMVYGYGTYFSEIRSFLESIRSANR